MKLLFLSFFLFLKLFSFSQNTLNVSLNLNSGEKYIFEVSEISDTKQIVMGEEQQIKQSDSYSILLEVISVSEDKNIHFKATYKHFRSEFKRENYTETYDTDSLPEYFSPEASYFKSLIGKSFNFNVTKKGDVLSLSGLKNVFKNENNIEIDSSSLKMLQEKYGKETIENNLFVLKYPEEDLLLYNIHDTVTSGILNIYNRSLSVGKDNSQSAEIKYNADISTDSDKSRKVGNVYISYELTGKLSGIIKTDKQSNLPLNYHCKQFISGSAGMKYSKNSDLAYTWPIKITNIITCTLNKITAQ